MESMIGWADLWVKFKITFELNKAKIQKKESFCSKACKLSDFNIILLFVIFLQILFTHFLKDQITNSEKISFLVKRKLELLLKKYTNHLTSNSSSKLPLPLTITS